MASHYSRVSETAASLAILERVLPNAVDLARTPVSHPENLGPPVVFEWLRFQFALFIIRSPFGFLYFFVDLL